MASPLSPSPVELRRTSRSSKCRREISQRRPGERRDPYAVSLELRDGVQRLSCNPTACGYGSRLGGRDDDGAVYGAAPSTVVIPRACGVSSTPRLLGFIADVPGILDHPPSRMMTPESVARSVSNSQHRHCEPSLLAMTRGYDFAFPRRVAPEFCLESAAQTGRGECRAPMHPQPRV
jgi:hypothetical protein